MRRIFSLGVAGFTGFVLLYISRFWPFTWWGRPGLFGIAELPSGGGLLQRWLRGTDFAPYELIIWYLIGFMVLTCLQWIFAKFEKA